MLVLRRRYEWWILMPALHRIGAIVIPATDQLLQSDIEYRANAADVKMIISYDNPNIQGEIDKAMPKSSTVKYLVTVGNEKRDGWISFHEEYERLPRDFLVLLEMPRRTIKIRCCFILLQELLAIQKWCFRIMITRLAI